MDNFQDKVRHIANLANLEFTDEEMANIAPQFSRILDYIETIDKIDLSEIEPMTHIVEDMNNLREDTSLASVPVQTALKNAPLHNDVFFKVPKVIE